MVARQALDEDPHFVAKQDELDGGYSSLRLSDCGTKARGEDKWYRVRVRCNVEWRVDANFYVQLSEHDSGVTAKRH